MSGARTKTESAKAMNKIALMLNQAVVTIQSQSRAYSTLSTLYVEICFGKSPVLKDCYVAPMLIRPRKERRRNESFRTFQS